MKDKNSPNNKGIDANKNVPRGDYRETSKHGRVDVNKGGSDPRWKNFGNKKNEN